MIHPKTTRKDLQTTRKRPQTTRNRPQTARKHPRAYHWHLGIERIEEMRYRENST
jgi:hypothetical protein